MFTLDENYPDWIQNWFYDADDRCVESTDVFDRLRVKQVWDGELEDAKQKDPDAVALEVCERKHPWCGEEQSQDIAQKQD